MIGGQFNLAKLIPGKEEFYETLRYFKHKLQHTGVAVHLGKEVSADELIKGGYDSIVLATGVTPRTIKLPNNSSVVNGEHTVKIVTYYEFLTGKASVGKDVAIIGAGGIGFDVADFITHGASHVAANSNDEAPLPRNIDTAAVGAFLNTWGVDSSVTAGGLVPKQKAAANVPGSVATGRKVYLLQRKKGKLGASLGKTTGWIHRTTMKMRGVEEICGCEYVNVTDDGLTIKRNGKEETLKVNTVVICAGQEPLRALLHPLASAGKGASPSLFMIGGAVEARELDAKRAIDQGTRLAACIETAKSGDVFNQPTTKVTQTVYRPARSHITFCIFLHRVSLWIHWTPSKAL